MNQPPSLEQLDQNFAAPKLADGMLWHDARSLRLAGLGWRNDERFAPYDRLPARAKPVVREAVWTLSEFSAGIHVRFHTDATEIAARWRLRNANLSMPHMPSTGMSGLDLYTRDQGRWHWVGLGRATALENKATLVKLHPGTREYLLYLPLYNGIATLEIGVPEGATLTPGPAWPGKPILFYGTSITHGGCASRAGMAYPSILSRRLESESINIGFSGNGWMELEIGRFIAELDPAVYVLDNLPNMHPEGVAKMTEPLVNLLRAARPTTPIVLVENIVYQQTLSDSPTPGHAGKNRELRAAFQRLQAAGVPHLHYVPADNLLGTDGEGTVDGTHPTDLGFLRMAEVLAPVLRPLV